MSRQSDIWKYAWKEDISEKQIEKALEQIERGRPDLIERETGLTRRQADKLHEEYKQGRF